MDKDDKKMFIDLFSKGVSEQNIEARHCETLSITLLIFAVTSVATVFTAILNAKGLHWLTFELMSPIVWTYGITFIILGFLLMTSRKQATIQARKGLEGITKLNPALSEYFQELAGINFLAQEGRFGSRSGLPKTLFFFGFGLLIIAMLFSLAEVIISNMS